MHTEESQGTFLHTDGWCQVNPFPQTTPRHVYIRGNTEHVRQISKSGFKQLSYKCKQPFFHSVYYSILFIFLLPSYFIKISNVYSIPTVSSFPLNIHFLLFIVHYLLCQLSQHCNMKIQLVFGKFLSSI